MAEAVAVAAPVAEATPGRGKKLKLLVVAVVVIALAAVAAKVFLLTGEADAGPPPPPEEGAVVPIGQMTTSLAGGTSYARVDIAAVTNAAADATALEEDIPLMRDQALTVLMGFTAEQLRTVEGADQLRDALTEKAQLVWEDDQVLRVVLTDLLVQ